MDPGGLLINVVLVCLGIAVITLLVMPPTLRLRSMRDRLWSAMSGAGPHRAAAVGLLAEGTFGPPGLFPQFRLFTERPLSWVGILVRDDTVEIWELRPVNGRPLAPNGTPHILVVLGGSAGVQADLRVTGDRLFPIVWLRWMHDGELACAGFAPIREDSFRRRPLHDAKFSALAAAASHILPIRVD